MAQNDRFPKLTFTVERGSRLEGILSFVVRRFDVLRLIKLSSE